MRYLILLFTTTVFICVHADITKNMFLREYWGVQRTQDFVSGGIPLPKGMVSDAEYISISDLSGTPLSFQSRPLMRWNDGSLRWVLLTFPADAAAQNTTILPVTFHKDSPAVQPPYTGGTVAVTEDGTHVTVTTGKVTFKIRKTGGFNLFDQVLIAKDGDNVVDDEIISSSLNNGALIYDHWDSTYTSGRDQNFTVKVEEAGPLRAVIKVTGNLSNGTDDHRFYGYLCRIYAFAGKSYVHVQYSLKNSYYTPRGALAFNGMNLDLQTNLSGSKQVTLYADNLTSQALSDSAYMFQPYPFGIEVKIGANTIKTVDTSDHNARALGWIDLSDNDWGVAVGIYEFASNCPNEVHAKAGGLIQARLWPHRYQQGSDSINYARGAAWNKNETDRYYIGMAEHKTHQLCYYFHAGMATDAGVENVMGAFNHPLRPQMDRLWISYTRAVPGEIYPDSAPIPDPSTTQMPLINAPLDDPSYTGAKAWNNREGQYYDTWVTFGEAFWRNETGDTEFYENQGTRYFRYMSPYVHRLLEANAWLYADMRRAHLDSVVVYDPQNSIHHWLSAADNVRDPVHSAVLPDGLHNVGYFRSWIAPTPGNQTEHYTSRDLFMYYLVSGDLKIRDGLYEYTETFPQYRVWRGRSGGQSRMARGDAATWSSLFFSAMVENSDTINGQNVQEYFLNWLHDWTQGISGKTGIIACLSFLDLWSLGTDSLPHVFMEALVDMPFCWYMDYFWDDTLSSYLNRRVAVWRDRIIGDNGGMVYHGWAPTGTEDNPANTSASNWRCPGPLALLYYHSQDTGLIRKIDLFCMDGTNTRLFTTGIDHGYYGKYDITAQQAYLFYHNNRNLFLQNPIITWDNDPSRQEKAPVEVDPGAILCVAPNPFNSNVKIMVRRYAYGVRRVSLQIYNISGKLVKDFTPYASRITPYAFTWNASQCASGIYIVQVTAGKKVFRKKAVLIK
jgi:hypothetical protein